MNRFIRVSLEDNENTEDSEKVNLEPNKTEQAIEAVEGKESTDPEKVIKVANYTEELAKIRQKNKEENNEQEPAEDSNQDQSESDNAEGEDNENTDDNSEENNEEENSSDDGDTDAKSQESSDGDEEVAMEHYIQQNMKQAFIAVESLTMLGRYKDMLERKLKVGGINQATALVIQNNIQVCADRVGFTFKKQLPALESYTGFTSNTINTRELNYSLESLISGIWEAIKKFFKSVWNWILEILGIRKKTNGSGKTMSTKEERTKREEAAIQAAKNLEEKLKNIDLARERDKEKNKKAIQTELSESIANHLFCSNDVGTFAEIVVNGDNIINGLKVCEDFIKTIQQINDKNLPLMYYQFQEPALQDYCIKKDIIGPLKIRETIKGNGRSSYIFITEEIVGGVGFEFNLSDPSVIVREAASLKAKEGFLQDIKAQTFGLAKVNVRNKNNNKKKVPLLDQNERSNLQNIVKNIKDQNILLSNAQKMLEDLAADVKKISDLGEPDSWTNQQNTPNYNEKVAYMKKLSLVSGVFATNLASPILKLDKLVANFADNFTKIDNLYS